MRTYEQKHKTHVLSEFRLILCSKDGAQFQIWKISVLDMVDHSTKEGKKMGKNEPPALNGGHSQSFWQHNIQLPAILQKTISNVNDNELQVQQS